jgi:hypothetical protein
MRTTVRLDDDLLRETKKLAADTGRTLTAVIEDALRAQLARRDAPGPCVDLPVSRAGGGTRPGVDLADNAAARDLMDGIGPS